MYFRCLKSVVFLFFIFLKINHIHAAAYAEGTLQSEGFKFKIGFEFQEDHHLCKWAIDRRDVQKIPIFTILDSRQQKLWHLEIDGQDIEFVTPPFSDNEGDKLKRSVESIDRAYKKLDSMRDWISKEWKEHNGITIYEWLYGIDVSDMPQKKTFENALKSQSNQILRRKLEEKLEGIYQSSYGLKYFFDRDNFTIKEEHIFSDFDVRNNKFNKIRCRSSFIPQVTIQHFLKYTIPLVLKLTPNIDSEQIIWAFPIIDIMNKSTENKYITDFVTRSENGLIFLHALTCASLTEGTFRCYREYGAVNFLNSLKIIRSNFELLNQQDAKLYLNFLSRRPFSEMWKDIKDSFVPNQSFGNLYHQRIMGNKFFYKEVQDNFKFLNYAEEYYDDQSKRYNFSEHKVRVSDNPEEHPDLLFLLEKGIISTRMIEKIKPGIFENYLDKTIDSVQNPSHRYDFDPVTFNPDEREAKIDSLSPPWFLDFGNSMGFYSIGNGVYHDANYGEAVLEMRSIKNISRDALTDIARNTLNIYGIGEAIKLLPIEEQNVSDDDNRFVKKFISNAFDNFLSAKERSLCNDASMLLFYLKSFTVNDSVINHIKKRVVTIS